MLLSYANTKPKLINMRPDFGKPTMYTLTWISRNTDLKYSKFYSLLLLDNLKKKNGDHKKVPKQGEDAGNLQILLHLRSLF